MISIKRYLSQINNKPKINHSSNKINISKRLAKKNKITNKNNNQLLKPNAIIPTTTTIIGTGSIAKGSAMMVGSSSVSTTSAAEAIPLLATAEAETAAVVSTEIAAEAGVSAALAPETLGLSLVVGGFVVAGTGLYYWFKS